MRKITGLRASILMGALSLLAGSAGAQRIEMPVGYRLTWIGARWNVGARVVDARGQQVAAPLVYRASDASIVSVNNRGEVVARKPGSTRVWAVSGRDSASAYVIVEQWPARFAFSPAQIRLDAVGALQPIRVLASDSAGVAIVGGTSRASTCRSLNDRVVTIRRDTVVAVANGATWIRCSDRGLADSIPAEVQQRAVTAVISNKAQLVRRSVGDTFSVRVVARDRLQKDVAGARPTWASLSPTTVSVDPLTGRARAVNGGTAKILVQVGDIADSTTIEVAGAAMYTPPVPVTPVADTTNRSRAEITGQEIFPYENDTAVVALTVTDSAGVPVPMSRVRTRIRDTTIAVSVDSARVHARKTGITHLVVSWGNLTDSVQISVRPRPVGGALRSDSAGGNEAFTPPPSFLDSIPEYQRIRARMLDSIARNANLASRSQRLVFSGNAIGAIAEHLSRTPEGITEDRTGAMYGGNGTLLLYQRLELAGGLRLGNLASVQDVGENLKITEAEASLGFFPIRALGIRAGGMLRAESSDIATTTWTIPKVSLVTRFSFIGDVFNTFAAFSLLPAVTFTGAQGTTECNQQPALCKESGEFFSYGGEAGLEARRGVVSGAITYYIEKISFESDPALNFPSSRIESFSAVRLRFGLNFGR